MKILLIICSFFITILCSAQDTTTVKNYKTPTKIDEAVEMACSCGESVLKRLNKRKSLGKKIYGNPAEFAHECAQNALDEYAVLMLKELDANLMGNAEDIAQHKHVVDLYNKRVNNECGALNELRNLKK